MPRALDPRLLVVGRLRRPHGLKGDCAVFPLTDDPASVFAPGRSVWRMNLRGETVAGPLVVERGRAYHREWLVAFRGYESRTAVDDWADTLLAAPETDLRPPAPGEVYVHELEGFAVVGADGAALGVVSGAYDLPAGLTLEVQGSRRQFLMPYRREFVREVDRPGRRLVVELPEGLLE